MPEPGLQPYRTGQGQPDQGHGGLPEVCDSVRRVIDI
jgi:hypothetical protein